MRSELQTWLPPDNAYDFVENHLKTIGRPVQALCGVEFRVPAQLTFDRWSSFNGPYLDQLRKWGLVFDKFSCICRSNIALDLHPPSATSLCAFSYTVPATTKVSTFLLSGQADIRSDGKIVAQSDTSPAGMGERARFVVETVQATLTKLRVSWNDTTRIALFHVHDIPGLWEPALLGPLGNSVRRGLLMYRARPPIVGLEVELEARAVRQEILLATK